MTVTPVHRAEPADKYFVDVARSVFDEYFERLGGHHSRSARANVVRYVSPLWFAEVMYLPEDGPNYSPRVVIGCLDEQYIVPRRNRVDIMHTVPEGLEEHSYNLRWTYRNRRKLNERLKLVRDRIVDIYAKPYLADCTRLQILLAQRYQIVEAKSKEQIDKHNATVFREKADKSFQARDYARALQFYDQIPRGEMTVTDEARVRYARSKVLDE